MTDATNTERLPLREKLGYALGDTGVNFAYQMVSYFFLIYLTDVAAIPAAAAGTLFLVARLADGLNDPVTGYLLDNWRLPARLGRIKGWLLIGSPLLAVNLVLLFSMPELPLTGRLIWMYVTYLVFGVVYDLVSTPYNALLAAMTQDPQQRNAASALRGVFAVAPAIVISMATVSLVALFPSPQAGYSAIVALFAVLGVLCLVICNRSVKERVRPAREKRFGLRQAWQLIALNRPLWVVFIATMMGSIGFNAFATIGAFYFKYNVGNAGLLGLATIAVVLGVFAGMGLSSQTASRLGKRNTYIAGCLIFALFSALRFAVPYQQTTLFMVTLALSNIGGGFTTIMGWSMLADTVDYGEWRTGHRAENLINSANTFVGKVSQGIGGALPAFLLGITGYVPNAASQRAEALRGIAGSVSLFPAACYLLAALALLFYPLRADHYRQVVTDLRERAAEAVD